MSDKIRGLLVKKTLLGGRYQRIMPKDEKDCSKIEELAEKRSFEVNYEILGTIEIEKRK